MPIRYHYLLYIKGKPQKWISKAANRTQNDALNGWLTIFFFFETFKIENKNNVAKMSSNNENNSIVTPPKKVKSWDHEPGMRCLTVFIKYIYIQIFSRTYVMVFFQTTIFYETRSTQWLFSHFGNTIFTLGNSLQHIPAWAGGPFAFLLRELFVISVGN